MLDDTLEETEPGQDADAEIPEPVVDPPSDDAGVDDVDDTPEAVPVAPPDVVDADEFNKRLDEATTEEGRLSLAKPYPIRGIPRPFEVMIAPPREQSFYEKVFELGSQDEPSDDDVDRSFVKALVLACVVQPALTEAHLDKLIEVSEHQFSALANRCLKTVYDEVGDTLDRIGQLSTGAQERVFVNVRGSTNTPTPV